MQRVCAILLATLTLGAGLLASACAERAAEPDHVTVQHLLISFDGKLQGKPIKRTQEEAKTLAHTILEQARQGEDFDALVEQHTDDQHPGIYAMANRGVTARGADEFPRESMVPGFGDVAFGLSLGGVGICEYDGLNSPYGYHILKRLE